MVSKGLTVLFVCFMVLPGSAVAGHRDCMDYCGFNTACRQAIEATHDMYDACTNYGSNTGAALGGHCETTYDPQRKYTWSTLHCSQATQVCTVKGVLQCPKNSGGWQNNNVDIMCEPKTIGGVSTPPYVFVDRDEVSCSWEDSSEVVTRCTQDGNGGITTYYIP